MMVMTIMMISLEAILIHAVRDDNDNDDGGGDDCM